MMFMFNVLILLLTLVVNSFGLTTDGVMLLAFKYSIVNDPLGVLNTWDYSNDSPCSWNGVVCSEQHVIRLSLPNSALVGSLPANFGLIPHLQKLDLSNNSINGSIPLSLYNASELRVLDLSNNYFRGNVVAGFNSLNFLDLSSNLLDGSLPQDFGNSELFFINVSHNNISGNIPPEFTNKIPTNATIDLSYNNLTGPIPESSVFYNQNNKSFVGNSQLCGQPLLNLCLIPSSPATSTSSSTSNNSSNNSSPPAIAAIPKSADSSGSGNSSNTLSASSNSKTGFKTTTLVGIIVGDIAGIAVLALIFIYIIKKRRRVASENNKEYDWASSSEDHEHKWLRALPCLNKKTVNESSSTSSTTTESKTLETEEDDNHSPKGTREQNVPGAKEQENKGELVTVDGGEKELELETLLKASAYILGATSSSIIYKAVLEDGTALAVRRIGESGLERFRDFENQVRVIAKLVHPNLVRIRGFYWGPDEKLVIYDYVPHGSLANARYRKVGSSPCPLPWEVRLKIAKGTARGLMYIHDKKQVHGNLKPSNILLGSDMEPKIGDFGLERLVVGDNSCKVGGSSRNFGSKRSTASRDSFQDITVLSNPSPSPSAMGCISPYYAPESLRSIKPTAKWDVFSYGVVLLELLTGKVIVSDEFGPASMTWSSTLTDEEKIKVVRMADVAIRGDMEGKEEALFAILKLGYNCISPIPQKRPHMKEVLHTLDKFPFASSYYCGHI